MQNITIIMASQFLVHNLSVYGCGIFSVYGHLYVSCEETIFRNSCRPHFMWPDMNRVLIMDYHFMAMRVLCTKEVIMSAFGASQNVADLTEKERRLEREIDCYVITYCI